MTEQTQRTQANTRAFLDTRGVPAWMQGLTMIVALVLAHELDRHLGGWVGFLVGVAVALALICTLPLLWRAYQR